MAVKRSTKTQARAVVERISLDSTTLFRSARLRASLTLAGAFRSPPKGVTKKADSTEALERRNVLMGLHTNVLAKGILVECPVQLVSADEDVLVALLAISASSMRRRELNPYFPDRKCLNEGRGSGNAIVIEVERSELVDLLGWGRNSKSYAAVSHSLARLANSTVTESPGTPEARSTNLIGFPENPWSEAPAGCIWPPLWIPNQERKNSDEDGGDVRWTKKGPVAVIISSFLSAPVLDTNPHLLFGLHFLHERRGLSPSARGIYSQLVALSWPGKEKRVAWNPIVKNLYGGKPTPASRSAAVRLLTKFPAGWKITFQGRGQKAMIAISRPNLITKEVMNTKQAPLQPSAKIGL